ncbi:MAG: ABC transporter ATP-binding protein [Bacteroidota bacterium]
MAKESISGKALDRSTLKRLIAYVKPHRVAFLTALGLTILLAIVGPFRPVLVQQILDGPVATGNGGLLRTMILALLLLLLVEGVLMYANTYMTSWLGQSIIKDIRKQVFDHILRLRLSFFDRTPIGTLQTRTISDIETLNDVFSSGLVRILGQLLQLFAIVGFMFYTSWDLALVVLTTLPLLIMATIIFKNKVKVSFQAVRKSVSDMNAFLQEHLSGMNIIHIFNREKKEMDRFLLINDQLRKANLNSVMYYSVYFPVIEIITALGMGILVWYGSGRVMQGELQFGELVAFIMFLQMFFRPLRTLADQFNMLQLGMVSAERIFKILDTREFITNEGKLEQLPKLENVSEKAVSVSFHDVSFAYKEPEWVLKNINFQVEAGQKLALVGSTGSGKTTIINLLSRFYEIQKGEIKVNGTDIKEYTLDSLRSLTGVVLQDVFLFSGSIYDNITLNNPDIPLDQVKEAAKQVGAHEFIMKLPGGYDYKVRERGATLSLGQRQLIAFARVMTYDPKVLVMDEATANIDTESEEIIQQAIETVMTGRTSIMIAHRLSTIQAADQILVLNRGNIIESGNHKQLMELKGAYYQLHQKQFAGVGH